MRASDGFAFFPLSLGATVCLSLDLDLEWSRPCTADSVLLALLPSVGDPEELAIAIPVGGLGKSVSLLLVGRLSGTGAEDRPAGGAEVLTRQAVGGSTLPVANVTSEGGAVSSLEGATFIEQSWTALASLVLGVLADAWAAVAVLSARVGYLPSTATSVEPEDGKGGGM